MNRHRGGEEGVNTSIYSNGVYLIYSEPTARPFGEGEEGRESDKSIFF